MAEVKEPEKTGVEKYGFAEEIAEDTLASNYGAYTKTGYPKPYRRYRLIYESQQASIEHTYFWVFNHCKQDQGFGELIKTIDTFAASENSSFWGMTEQRKGIQQDRASQYLATIGKMTKELFQIVREIRILKERLILYKGAEAGKQADDIALKGYWVDMVEGGTRQQANIYTMAQQLGFGTLPDLFFSLYVKDQGDVDKVVDKGAGEFNTKVKEVLRRKLSQYMAWRQETYKELQARDRFTLRYLRQHWAVIRMYISWVKPYLRNVQKLQAPEKYDRNPEIVSSFEGALMEIEFIARKAPMDDKGTAPTILASFNYRVKPRMEFHTEGYQQRGAVHVGRVEFSLRTYGWTNDDVQKYLEYRDAETLELIGMVDQSVKDAMEALGDELKKYLKEAGEDVNFGAPEPEKVVVKKASVNMFEPFIALYTGFKEIVLLPVGPMVDALKPKHEKKDEKRGTSEKAKGAAKAANGGAFQVFKNYKKAHGMPSW